MRTLRTPPTSTTGNSPDRTIRSTVRFDTSKLVQMTQALIDAGFTDDEIRAAMGGNAIRVLKAGIAPMASPAPPPSAPTPSTPAR